jgi:hypothetical protein
VSEWHRQFYQFARHEQDPIACSRIEDRNLKFPEIHLVFAWAGILAGFISGMALGLFFHRNDWLGGYDNLKRRLYRLGHISFFGLAAVNFIFYLTARDLLSSSALTGASLLFIVGALSMPLCCLIMAHFQRAQFLFAIPVLSLITAGALTLMEVIKQ